MGGAHRTVEAEGLPRCAVLIREGDGGQHPMTAPVPNTDLAVLFLVGLDKYGRHDLVAINPYVPGGDVECATFLSNQRAEMRAWIDARQGKRNLYTSVNQARDDAPKN